MDFVELKVKEREKAGKSVCRQLRAAGLVPAVLYGGSKQKSVALELEQKELTKLLASGQRNAILKLKGLAKDTTAIIKDIQKDHTRTGCLHLDFLRVQMDAEIETALTLECVGEAVGVTSGGVLQQTLRELTIRALPKDIPEKYELNISELDIGNAIKISDLRTLPGVEILANPEDVVVSVVPPTELKEEELAPEEAEEGAEEEGEAKEEEGAEEEAKPEEKEQPPEQ